MKKRKSFRENLARQKNRLRAEEDEIVTKGKRAFVADCERRLGKR